MSNNKRFVISCSYQWYIEGNKNSISEEAIKKIVDAIKKRYSGKKHNPEIPYKIDFRRLRASAGRFLADNFYKRIKESDAIIIDITHHNNNVMMELGMAYAIQKDLKPNLSIYLISENKIDLPSNMSGYFVSVYKNEKNKIVFKDQNSLIMSISSDVLDFYNKISPGQSIDEIN